ncbi:hypothetical protein, partial [Fulvivirga aurantia]|uniref:hypothetical protein n=1 Tax=Fulvivirga aurantia TaxID=2529383 RepID=UPI001624E9B3
STIEIVANDSQYDTLYLREFATEQIITTIPTQSTKSKISFSSDRAKIVSITTDKDDYVFLKLIEPGRSYTLKIKDLAIITPSVADSLSNYIWQSGNRMFKLHAEVIQYGKPSQVLELYDSLIQTRQAQIEALKNQLSDNELQLLLKQNTSRAHGFLFFYGRELQELTPNDDFFTFVKNIDLKDEMYIYNFP